jgi:hypothetical protein
MRKSIRLLAAALGVAVFAPVAHAQDMTAATATAGGTTIWVGGGIQFLSLPDIKFTWKNDHRQTNSSSDWSDFGGAVGGGFETALGFWNGTRLTGGIKGFWANIQTDDRTRCSGDCYTYDPAGDLTMTYVGTSLSTLTDRDVDYWGTQGELKFGRAEPMQAKPNFYRNDYLIIGADVRGIDQNNKLRSHGDFRYNETLDTTYYGGYIGFGGEYSFGFIPGLKNVGGLYDRLGLRTYISARAGLYSANTDYNGRYTSWVEEEWCTSKLSESNDKLAFIGTVSLETRKQIGPRTSLSLWTDYEYISSVPKMRYADEEHATRIDDEGVFASRTMLRLNIGFGPAQLYEEPLK